MSKVIDHYELESALQHSGSTWSAAQAHGLLCSRLAVLGADGCREWLGQVLETVDDDNALQSEGAARLDKVSAATYRQLAERQSEFEPVLPDESESASILATALAEWCEGFLHGLVSNVHDETLKTKLATEPLSDIIKDLLEMTRAEADNDDDEASEEAITELVEYLRVAAQLVYEELAEFRRPAGNTPTSLPDSETVH